LLARKVQAAGNFQPCLVWQPSCIQKAMWCDRRRDAGGLGGPRSVASLHRCRFHGGLISNEYSLATELLLGGNNPIMALIQVSSSHYY
jgi:hypothetical protein